MQDEPSRHARSSAHTTGNDPIDGVDAGGTRSTKPGNSDKSQPRQQNPRVSQTIVSGGRNNSVEGRTPRKPDLPSF